MNKESIQQRLDELDKAMQQVLANYNALEGAKQECLIWLKKLDEQGETNV